MENNRKGLETLICIRKKLNDYQKKIDHESTDDYGRVCYAFAISKLEMAVKMLGGKAEYNFDTGKWDVYMKV